MNYRIIGSYCTDVSGHPSKFATKDDAIETAKKILRDYMNPDDKLRIVNDGNTYVEVFTCYGEPTDNSIMIYEHRTAKSVLDEMRS